MFEPRVVAEVEHLMSVDPACCDCDELAALVTVSGRVLGLMPHPERHVLPTQHPQWTRRGPAAEGDGLRLFRNAVRFFG